LPQRLIGDRAYDADPLDDELAKLGVEMIAPHRRNRKKPKLDFVHFLLSSRLHKPVARLLHEALKRHRGPNGL
jgi:hypothetical protein